MLIDIQFDTETDCFVYKGYEIFTWYNAYHNIQMWCVIIDKELDIDKDFQLFEDMISYIDDGDFE